MNKIIKSTGIVFWITGLSGSGKSTIGVKLKKLIESEYGKTIIIHGDDVRKIYNNKSYSKMIDSNWVNLIQIYVN